ncbi:MAG TPA: hypothetical protein VIV14_02055, partial [Gammaproteobacteria bacterium]
VLAISLVLRPGMLYQPADGPASGAISDSPDAFAPATITIERDANVGPAESADLFDLEEAAAEQRAREVAPALRQEAAGTAADIQTLSAEPAMIESAAFAASFGCDGVDRSSPEEWITCINAGAERGFLEDARSALEAFVAAYPDYAVPQSLEPLLDQ